MRERKTFAERTHVFISDETVRKYFLVFEGSKTEEIYFDAVNAMREELGISSLIEIIPIVRSYSEDGWSNPKKILDRLIENLQESKTNKISVETLLNRMMDYFYEMKIITDNKVQAKSIWKAMCRICEEKGLGRMDTFVEDIEKSCSLIINSLQEEYDLLHAMEDISNAIKEGGFTYAEGFDKICLIVDRDRASFISSSENNQYQYVVEKCKEMGFELYVTNPCFEFWLLLHFDGVFDLDGNKLLENPRITAKRRYSEQQLRILWPGYRKSAYRAKELVKNIDRAICNEREFCEDIDALEHSVGSNIGKLILNLRQEQR